MQVCNWHHNIELEVHLKFYRSTSLGFIKFVVCKKSLIFFIHIPIKGPIKGFNNTCVWSSWRCDGEKKTFVEDYQRNILVKYVDQFVEDLTYIIFNN